MYCDSKKTGGTSNNLILSKIMQSWQSFFPTSFNNNMYICFFKFYVLFAESWWTWSHDVCVASFKRHFGTLNGTRWNKICPPVDKEFVMYTSASTMLLKEWQFVRRQGGLVVRPSDSQSRVLDSICTLTTTSICFAVTLGSNSWQCLQLACLQPVGILSKVIFNLNVSLFAGFH